MTIDSLSQLKLGMNVTVWQNGIGSRSGIVSHLNRNKGYFLLGDPVAGQPAKIEWESDLNELRVTVK